mmetsp:Transcript_26314/g.78142  ORF Transcript_26314/g.78142 Transcript_26314/m.78142 type:complete len:228 (+) Transcript_26314:1236-1919(+)
MSRTSTPCSSVVVRPTATGARSCTTSTSSSSICAPSENNAIAGAAAIPGDALPGPCRLAVPGRAPPAAPGGGGPLAAVCASFGGPLRADCGRPIFACMAAAPSSRGAGAAAGGGAAMMLSSSFGRCLLLPLSSSLGRDLRSPSPSRRERLCFSSDGGGVGSPPLPPPSSGGGRGGTGFAAGGGAGRAPPPELSGASPASTLATADAPLSLRAACPSITKKVFVFSGS